jgi:hypothetical protein
MSDVKRRNINIVLVINAWSYTSNYRIWHKLRSQLSWEHKGHMLDFYSFKWLSFSGQGHSGRVILQFFKKERFRKRNYRTRYLTCAYVFNHIEVFYNRTQIHSHLGGVCPEACESASNRGLSLSTVLEEHCEIFKKHLRNTYLVNSY